MKNVVSFHYNIHRNHHAHGACYHFGTAVPSVSKMQCTTQRIINNSLRDGVVITASASQSVDLRFITQVELYQNTLKMVFTTSLLGAEHIGMMWRTTGKHCLLCPWARHLSGCLHFQVADRWWNHYPLWWPSLTKDMQTEHVLVRINSKRDFYLKLLSL